MTGRKVLVSQKLPEISCDDHTVQKYINDTLRQFIAQNYGQHNRSAVLAVSNKFTADENQFVSSSPDLSTITESPNVFIERSLKIIRESAANIIGFAFGSTGTLAAPAALTSGDVPLDIRARGYDGAAFSGDAGNIIFSARQAWTGAAHGLGIDVYATALGATARAIVASFDVARIAFEVPARLKGYTVATLPAGTVGDTAYVTDALAPAFLTIIAGGGAIKTPVFYNGTNWVAM